MAAANLTAARPQDVSFARVDGHLELGLVLRRGERPSLEKAGGDDEEDDFAFHGYTLVHRINSKWQSERGAAAWSANVRFGS